METLVSIIINNHNYARYVGKSIESALAQSHRNTEVIVVDDGSQDESRDVIARYGSSIKPIFKDNGGQASALNVGFAESCGKVICVLDSDDVFLPTKVERVVEALTKFPKGWCFHHLQWVDANLEPMPTPSLPYGTGFYDFRSEFLRSKCPFAPPATSGLAFSRHLLEKLMPMPDSIKQFSSDNYLKFSALGIEPGYFIAEQLALQRIHAENWYTGRNDAALRANVQLATAAGLRGKVPALRQFCNRLFADGLINKWRAGATVGTISAEMQEYFADSSFIEKTEMLARIAYRAARKGVSLQLSARP